MTKNIETEPWWWVAKEKFLNWVCSFKTDLDPFELLEFIQNI